MPYAKQSQPHKRQAATSTGNGSGEAKSEPAKPLPDVYQRITDQIVAAIEAGAGDWQMPWHTDQAGSIHRPVNAFSDKLYRGVNVVALWAAGAANGYDSSEWATYQQWLERGAQVRKGEKSTSIVFWKVGEKGEAASEESSREEEIRVEGRPIFARSYAVFNAAQVDGFTSKRNAPTAPASAEQRIEHIEAFFAALGADIRHGGNRAFCRPSSDHIQMPPFAAFHDPIAYYSTLGHEAAHWTSAKHRLNRELTGRFGSEAYAAEELIAELSAAFLSADLQLTNAPRPDHAAYVANWLKVLKNDSRAIFTAAARAQQAADYLHGLQVAVPTPEPEPVNAPTGMPIAADTVVQFRLDL